MKNGRTLFLTAASYADIVALSEGLIKSIEDGGYGKVTSVGDTSTCTKYPGVCMEISFEADSKRASKSGHVLPFLQAPSNVFRFTPRDRDWKPLMDWTLKQDVEPGFVVAHWQKGNALVKECYPNLDRAAA